MKKAFVMAALVLGLLLLISFPATSQPPPSPTIVYLNFEGDPNFPNLTTLRDTTSLAPFTGSAFRLSTEERDEVVQGVVDAVREDFRDFNIRFVTDAALLSGDYYTWGIDDTAYVWRMLSIIPASEFFEQMFINRLYGRAGFNPNAPQHLGLNYARTWAGSFALVPEVDMPILALVDRNEWPETIDQPIFQIVHPPYSGDTFQQVVIDIPTQPFDVPDSWDGTLAQPTRWIPSAPPLIQYKDCLVAEERHPHTGWGCGAASLNGIIQALANSAAHEISHLFGTLHDTDDDPVPGFIIDAYTDDCPGWMGGACVGHLLVSQTEYVESNYDKSFGPDNYQILMNRLGPAPPDNPELTSPSHSKGQPSCEKVLTVEWDAPWAVNGVGGYSYTIVNQDDPFYDINRTPDYTIGLDATATSFTTLPLEPGHVWEFNIRTVDTNGLWADLYSSFWVEIESCSAEVWVIPREGAVYDIGEWVNIYWGPVTYGGDDVGSCYDVSLALLKGPDVVMDIGSNIPNSLSYGFRVPDAESGADYNIRMIMDRKSFCEQYNYPENFIGFSNNFSITRPPSGDFDGDGDLDMDDVTIFRETLGSEEGDANYNPDADFDGDGRITMNDYRILRSLYTGG